MDSSTSTTSSNMSREDLYLFHSMDRLLYSILVLNLARDPVQSMHVLALWLWLEKVGYSKMVPKILALTHTMIDELADEAVLCLKCMSRVPIAGTSDNSRNENLMLKNLLDIDISFQFFYENWFKVIEGVDKIVNHVCVRAFQDIIEVRRNSGKRTAVKTHGGPVEPNSSNSHLLIQQTAGLGEAGLGVYTDGVNDGILLLPSSSSNHFFNRQVAAPSGARGLGVSGGLVLQSNSANARFSGHQAAGPSGVRGLGANDGVPHGMMLPNSSNDHLFSRQVARPSGSRPIVFGDFENNGLMLLPHSQADHLFSQQVAELSELAGLAISDRGENYYYPSNYINDDEVDKRTMFVTFSKGYPVREVELIEFFTRTFGECIESLYMQDVTPERQPLFARIVFLHSSTVELVLSGGVTKAKFNINGKHVWARRFVPKRSMTAEHSANLTTSCGILDLISRFQDYHF